MSSTKKRKPKILLARADAGMGHKAASTALKAIFDKHYPDYEVKEMDIFKVADVQPFNSVDTIHQLISSNYSIEQINNAIIRLLNTGVGYAGFRQYLLFWMFEECARIIAAEKPDLVVTLHPLVGMVVQAVKERRGGFKTAVVIQDLVTIFRGWADTSADLIISPTSDAVNTLVKYGVKVENIVYPLFPVRPSLANFRTQDEVLGELGFSSDKTTVLVTGGGVGTKPMLKGVDELLKDDRIQIAVVTGKLAEYKQRLEYKYRTEDNVKILGFVKLQDYINAADIIVTKPGPANLIEVELFNKKAVVSRKVGWQEIGNIHYALRNPKFRYIGDDWGKLRDAVYDLLDADVREPKNGHRRNFGESKEIVEELIKLVK